MQNNERQNQPGGLNLADVYYVIFRHKWKIICLSAAGLLAAAGVYLAKPPAYSSEAKLLIRYVVESRVPSGMGGDPQIKNPDPGGANIINSEIEIIRSLDLASQVVEAVGADKILGTTGGDTNKYKAAAILQKSLVVEVPPRSDILRIVFQSPNRDIVQSVLTQLIDAYMRKHVEIHRGIGAFDDVLTQQTDALRSQLAQTEEDLRRAKTNAGVMSVEESKKAYTEEISKIREQLFNTQAELAERQAALEERQKLLPTSPTASTNQVEADIPAAIIDEYQTVSARVDSFRKKEQELLSQYTDENSLVRGIHEQVVTAEKAQKKLQAEFPRLAKMQPAASKPGAPVVDLSEEAAQIIALQAKMKVLNAQFERMMTEAKSINALEPAITELQRKRDLEETKYRHFSTSLEQARFDEALGAGKMSNISVAQSPSPPYRESRQLVKTLGMLAAGGVAAGFALAFLLELFLDPTVRRPIEVETRLHLPLFLTIPKKAHKRTPALPAPSAETAKDASGLPAPAPASAGSSTPVPWQANGLGSYYEALRDRLVTYFEIHNLVHKPKLIAVTGCNKGAGVTTIAAGLAASLSETGDGNVLLVDMTTGHGAAHPFFKGKPGGGLADALENETRDSALVQENLYAVAETSADGQLPRALPRRFHNLMPKLKASDYDYIIFDMPPVSQISPTARVASFMDMVLLVLESEKTDRDAVKRAAALLSESKAKVGTILNKTQRYVPERLQQEG